MQTRTIHDQLIQEAVLRAQRRVKGNSANRFIRKIEGGSNNSSPEKSPTKAVIDYTNKYLASRPKSRQQESGHGTIQDGPFGVRKMRTTYQPEAPSIIAPGSKQIYLYEGEEKSGEVTPDDFSNETKSQLTGRTLMRKETRDAQCA